MCFLSPVGESGGMPMRFITDSVVITIALVALAPADAFAQQGGWATRLAELEAEVAALEEE
jgi:hypothetical protein